MARVLPAAEVANTLSVCRESIVMVSMTVLIIVMKIHVQLGTVF